MYGETFWAASDNSAINGLSPHVRGNRVGDRLDVRVLRSIPACTGKPSGTMGAASPGPVYPRMYGETLTWCATCGLIAGLSPHVRGNRASPASSQAGSRSIPACTGKPFSVDTLYVIG